ncbi:MAG: AAA family ATPase, partial [Xenococcaceae cyanobacterium MO_188.B19]|nr:AAA family ATPase [Xenococcaceae cyanobacterium MO_188.B19]
MTDTITLTNSQQQALEKLKQFVKSNQQHFRLTGYAGSGKSFLMAQFMKWLLSQRLEFIAASPTNKAAKNLKKIGLENNIDFEVTTVAKLLGQQP